jgi:hypothetical protein
LGVGLALPANQFFAAGTKRVLLLNFNVAIDVQEGSTTPITFFAATAAFVTNRSHIPARLAKNPVWRSAELESRKWKRRSAAGFQMPICSEWIGIRPIPHVNSKTH